MECIQRHQQGPSSRSRGRLYRVVTVYVFFLFFYSFPHLYDMFFSGCVSIQMLRKMLDERGFPDVRIVAADKKWRIAEDILKDTALATAVDFIG